MDVLPRIRRYKRSGMAKLVCNEQSVNNDNFIRNGRPSFNNNTLVDHNLTRNEPFKSTKLARNIPSFSGYNMPGNRPSSNSYSSVRNGSSPNSYLYEYYFERAKEKEVCIVHTT